MSRDSYTDILYTVPNAGPEQPSRADFKLINGMYNVYKKKRK